MLSIDQNCHPLWDVLPKLQALALRGQAVTHGVEDIDTAFTAVGGSAASALRFAPERYYRSGGADWGAAIFYHAFLGRLPVEIRQWEPYTGRSTKALAKELQRSVDDLYDAYSPSDNWQLIGPSYVGEAGRHRTIADLSVRETGPFLREMMALARKDMRERFPTRQSQERCDAWFAAEARRLDALLARHADGSLVDLYADWLTSCLQGQARVVLTSDLFALSRPAGHPRLLQCFCRDYPALAELYNAALAQTNSELRPLRTDEGELPFFAAYDYQGHRVRSVLRIEGDTLRTLDHTVPLPPGGGDAFAALADAGISAIAGKAVLLVLQARTGPAGDALALPYRGSLYVPAAHRLAEALLAEGRLDGPLRPLVRVRFRLLDRLRSLDTPLCLPEHLAAAMGETEVPARALGERWASLAADASDRLGRLRDDAQREAWQREAFPSAFTEIDALDAKRRERAKEDPRSPDVREASHRIRDLQRDVLEGTVRQIALDWQVRDVDYWDSRGALWPWCLALGGEGFYHDVVSQAEIYTEGPLRE